nr:putative integron gene cassette protein [uncultured bacterium]
MTSKSVLDRLSEGELARHRRELSYAQVQQCKRGEFEVVARKLQRGYRKALWGHLAMSLVVVVMVICGLHWILLFQVAGSTLAIAYMYIQARRTAQTVHRLMEERERSEAGSANRPA